MRGRYEKAKAATFVLITNLADAKDYPAVKILKEYKQGNSVEGRFRFLKNPFLLGPVFLKTERRVEAMAFIFQLALLVAAYFEYRVRQSLKNEDRPLVPGRTVKPISLPLLPFSTCLKTSPWPRSGQTGIWLTITGPR